MNGTYSRHLLVAKVQLAIIDAFSVLSAVLAATVIRHRIAFVRHIVGDVETRVTPLSAYALPSVLIAALVIVVFKSNALYTLRLQKLHVPRIIRALTTTLVIALAVTFFYRGYSYSRIAAILAWPLSIGFVIVGRVAFRSYLTVVMRHRNARRRVLVVGFGACGRRIAAALLEHPAYYDLVGFVDDDRTKIGAKMEGRTVLGDLSSLEEVIRTHRVDEVIIAIPSAPADRLLIVIGECLRLRVLWRAVPDLLGLRLDRLQFDTIDSLPVIGVRGSNIVGFNWISKRALDIAFASATLIVVSPLLLLIGVLIKVTSRGPLIFRQTRVGLNGERFTMLKFRTMKTDASAAIHEAFTSNWIHGRTGSPRSLGAAASAGGETIHKIVKDPRVTFIGRILRRTSLDELPQFWNVLRGEMSVVGPRPPLPYEVDRYTQWHKRRLEALPGITGLWQISGRNSLTFDEMVHLDIEYIENWSLKLDFEIILKTVPAMARKAY